MDRSAIHPEMAVVGSDGEHVGIVDRVDGEMIRLSATDPTAGGQAHYIPISWVDSVESAVRLRISSSEAGQAWQTETERGATDAP